MTSNPNDHQIVSKISGKQRTIRFLNFIHPLIFIAIPALIFWGFTCWERQTAKGICLVVLGCAWVLMHSALHPDRKAGQQAAEKPDCGSAMNSRIS